MLILTCCLFGEVETVEAGTVDINGQCVNMSVSAGETVMPIDICVRKGLGSCYNAAGSIEIFAGTDCGGANVSAPNTILICDHNTNATADGKSARLGLLLCNEKSWGFVPKPDNVPGDFDQSMKNTTD